MSRNLLDKAMSEKELQDWCESLLTLNGWRWYHVNNSRWDKPGFPDLCCTDGKRLMFLELKRQNGKVRPDQQVWLTLLTAVADTVNKAVGYEIMIVRLWRPSDRDEIERIVYGRSKP